MRCGAVNLRRRKVYSVGEKIVYPMHGAGTVEAVESRQFGDKTALYYKVCITAGSITLMIPVENQSGVQLRPIVSETKAKEILDNFVTEPEELDIPWNKRHKYNMDRLKLGTPESVAKVLSELITREKNHGLSTGDRKMLVLTKNILCSELSVALGMDAADIFEQILSKF